MDALVRASVLDLARERRGSCALELPGRAWQRRIPAPVMKLANSAAIAAVLSLVKNMVLSTPFVKDATLAEINPAVTAFPEAIQPAASEVDPISREGSAAKATQSQRRTADKGVDQPKPLRVSRRVSAVRACSNRRTKVLLLHPIWLAASSCVRPSRQQRINGSRSFSGSRANS